MIAEIVMALGAAASLLSDAIGGLAPLVLALASLFASLELYVASAFRGPPPSPLVLSSPLLAVARVAAKEGAVPGWLLDLTALLVATVAYFGGALDDRIGELYSSVAIVSALGSTLLGIFLGVPNPAALPALGVLDLELASRLAEKPELRSLPLLALIAASLYASAFGISGLALSAYSAPALAAKFAVGSGKYGRYLISLDLLAKPLVLAAGGLA